MSSRTTLLSKLSLTLLLMASAALSLYSYTQVDLNLTLSSNFIYQTLQQSLTQIGYFNRPLSTLIYIVILTTLFSSYFSLIYLSKKSKLQFSKGIKLLLTISLLLFVAYPAFSYDIFNYIFDARIAITHHANPWTHTALDFPADEWTRFMRWTHRTYPYGPAWILLSLPFYISGLGKFILTLFSFKLIGLLSYWLSIFSIHHITQTNQPKLSQLSVILFATNPLILIEVLVSAHLDAAMAAFMLFSLYLFFTQHKLKSILVYIFAGLTKYVSFAAAPIFFVSKKYSFNQLLNFSILLSYLLTLVIITQREILPWYFVTPFALTCLNPKNKIAISLMIAISLATLSRYIPFLYIGDYTSWVIQSRNTLSLVLFPATFILTYPLASRISAIQKS